MNISSAASTELEQLRNLFADPDQLATVGRFLKTQMPADASRLWAMSGLPHTAATDTDQLALTFAAKRKSDFLDGRIVTVNGWLMAESECAICVLLTES